MGKVEKIAVLSVLFLIAVILVVSMTTDNPIDTANAAVLGDKTGLSGPAATSGSEGGSTTLLSATVDNTQPASAAPTPAVPQPMAIPSGSLLKTTEGLAPGYDSQRLLYTWQSGDTYVTVAMKLYGQPAKFSVIQNANEGREGIQTGEKILVPIFDVENVPDETAAVVAPKAEKPAAKAKHVAVASAAGRTHTVKKGESLWKIAKAELGDANRWNDIYELNKDKLKSPEALRDGMQLKLP